MELAALQSIVSAEVPGSSGCLAPPRARRFRRPHVVFPRRRPRSLSRSGSSSRELCLPFRVRPASNPPDAREHRAPPLGFRLPFAAPACGVHTRRGSHSPSLFRPRRFSRPRRFPPPHTLWACFIPQPRPGFALQGFSPPPSRAASSASRALLPLATLPCHRVAPVAPGHAAPPSGL